MNAKILWVDDEVDLLGAHIYFLRQRGYDVQTAPSGADALDLVRAEDFDLMLLDENMPGLSGIDTLTAVKQLRPELPVVMVTKNEGEDIMDRAIGRQIADYLIKPVHPTQVLLSLKKNIHQRQIVREQTEQDCPEQYRRISSLLEQAQSPEDWVRLYQELTAWELQTAEAAEAAGAAGASLFEMHRSLCDEANREFARFVAANYEQWVASPQSRPTMSPDVMRREVFPRLREGKKVFLLVLDNLRYDQWRTICEDLAPDFHISEQLYWSILPTATQYARNAIFAGLFPADIRRQYPRLWVDEEQDEGKNLSEEALIREQLARFRRREPFSYHKLSDSTAADRLLQSFQPLLRTPLNVLVVNFIDILSHARTESATVRELSRGEAAFRSLTRSWFRHSSVRELFRLLSTLDYEVLVTTDHGSLRVTQPTRVVGTRELNTNLRYKLGRSLTFQPREVLHVQRPEAYGLPAPRLATSYIFAHGSRFFAYPNNFNYYVQHYRDTFQHGGISMQEMLVPLVWLRPKG